jgi:hypothetical protein
LAASEAIPRDADKQKKYGVQQRKHRKSTGSIDTQSKRQRRDNIPAWAEGLGQQQQQQPKRAESPTHNR